MTLVKAVGAQAHGSGLKGGLSYELEGIKDPSPKSLAKSSQKRAVKVSDSLSSKMLVWLLVKRTIVFVWVNKKSLTVACFVLENGYILDQRWAHGLTGLRLFIK